MLYSFSVPQRTVVLPSHWRTPQPWSKQARVWYYPLLLADGTHDIAWIADHLRLPVPIVEDALSHYERLGYVADRQPKLVRVPRPRGELFVVPPLPKPETTQKLRNSHYELSPTIPSDAFLCNFHAQHPDTPGFWQRVSALLRRFACFPQVRVKVTYPHATPSPEGARTAA